MPRYLPGPVKTSPDGHPVYILEHDDGTRRFVVVRPEGAYYCDENGNLRSLTASEGAVWLGLLIGGALGALLGPWGAVAGAALGAAGGEAVKKAGGNA